MATHPPSTCHCLPAMRPLPLSDRQSLPLSCPLRPPPSRLQVYRPPPYPCTSPIFKPPSHPPPPTFPAILPLPSLVTWSPNLSNSHTVYTGRNEWIWRRLRSTTMFFPSYPTPPSPPILTNTFMPTATPLTVSYPSFIGTQFGYKHKIYNLQFIYLQPHPPLVYRTLPFFFFFFFFS